MSCTWQNVIWNRGSFLHKCPMSI